MICKNCGSEIRKQSLVCPICGSVIGGEQIEAQTFRRPITQQPELQKEPVIKPTEAMTPAPASDPIPEPVPEPVSAAVTEELPKSPPKHAPSRASAARKKKKSIGILPIIIIILSVLLVAATVAFGLIYLSIKGGIETIYEPYTRILPRKHQPVCREYQHEPDRDLRRGQ